MEFPESSRGTEYHEMNHSVFWTSHLKNSVFYLMQLTAGHDMLLLQHFCLKPLILFIFFKERMKWVS